MPCPICHGSVSIFDRALVYGCHEAVFVRCMSCGFMHIDKPGWLEDAYASPITASDTGLMERNIWFAKISSAIISTLFDPDGKFIDYGGGEGVYTGLMRQRGYNFFWYDKYAKNVHSKTFEADLSGSVRYDLLTAVELFEHLTDPLAGITEMFRLSSSILFTTHLLPDPPPAVGKWWYYALEHGQHVAFYSRRTLQHVADSFGVRLSTNGRNLHLLSDKSVPEYPFRLLTSVPVASLVSFVRRKPAPTSGSIHVNQHCVGNKDAHRH